MVNVTIDSNLSQLRSKGGGVYARLAWLSPYLPAKLSWGGGGVFVLIASVIYLRGCYLVNIWQLARL